MSHKPWKTKEEMFPYYYLLLREGKISEPFCITSYKWCHTLERRIRSGELGPRRITDSLSDPITPERKWPSRDVDMFHENS